MNDPKPCPNPKCRNTAVFVTTTIETLKTGSGPSYGRCRQCGVQGPVEDTLELAEAAWNALPREPEPEWSGSPPSGPGWYVVRYKKGGDRIEYFEADEVNAWPEFTKWRSQFEWTGPIPMPPEPI